MYSRREPPSRAHYVRPRMVYFWSLLKGGVDVYSRVMSNNGFHVKGLGSKAEFYIRAFLTAIYNTYICRRLLLADRYPENSAETYSGFRNRVNQFGTMKDTFLDILEGNLLFLEGELFRSCELATLRPNTGILLELTVAAVSSEELIEVENSITARRNANDFLKAWNPSAGIKHRQTGFQKEGMFGFTETRHQIRKWCRYCSRFGKGKDYGYRRAYYCPQCFNTPLFMLF